MVMGRHCTRRPDAGHTLRRRSDWRPGRHPNRLPAMSRAQANGIEIEYETFGDRTDPALLLV
jgi:hypothetical protein